VWKDRLWSGGMYDAVVCKEWGEWRYLVGTTGRGGTNIVVHGSHKVTATHDDGIHISVTRDRGARDIFSITTSGHTIEHTVVCALERR